MTESKEQEKPEANNVVAGQFDALVMHPTADCDEAIGELHQDFGDPETLLNSRDWLRTAVEEKGAKFEGGGIGFGQADIDVLIEGCRYNISIKPILNDVMSNLISGRKLTPEQIEDKARERAEEHAKPYWAFVWEDPQTGSTGNVNFCMPEGKAIQSFEKAHPDVSSYRIYGSDA